MPNVCQCPHPAVVGRNPKTGSPVYRHQDLSLHNPELFYELNDSSAYKDFISDKCHYCPATIPGSWAYYRKNGNCCSECSVRQAENAAKRTKKH